MTITLGSWAIPAFLTAIIWIACMLRPADTSGYCSLDITGMLLGIAAIIGTLVIWLIYFAARFALG